MRRFGLIAALLLPLAAVVPAQASAGPTASVTGVWFMDRDRDGTQQQAEPGADMFSVKLVDAEGQHLTSAYTDENGNYRFDDIAPGNYRLVFGSDGYVSTTPEEVPVSVAAGDTGRADFGMQGGEISGVAWEDVNGDGQRQPDEPVMVGLPVRMPYSPEPVAYTAEDGSYHIYDLWVTDYNVSFELRAGMTFSPPMVGDNATDSNVIDFDDGKAQASLWVGRPGIVNAVHIDAGYVPK